jgi:hypothetical protein
MAKERARNKLRMTYSVTLLNWGSSAAKCRRYFISIPKVHEVVDELRKKSGIIEQS